MGNENQSNRCIPTFHLDDSLYPALLAHSRGRYTRFETVERIELPFAVAESHWITQLLRELCLFLTHPVQASSQPGIANATLPEDMGLR